MRPIKFRGYSEGSEGWVYGFLDFHDCFHGEYENPIISYFDEDENVGWTFCHVYENSVGQFTGAEDGHGTDIYEGDIIRDGHGRVYEVEWDEDEYQFVLRTPEGIIRYTLGGFVNDFIPFKVIGNKFENKELMEGGEG